MVAKTLPNKSHARTNPVLASQVLNSRIAWPSLARSDSSKHSERPIKPQGQDGEVSACTEKKLVVRWCQFSVSCTSSHPGLRMLGGVVFLRVPHMLRLPHTAAPNGSWLGGSAYTASW